MSQESPYLLTGPEDHGLLAVLQLGHGLLEGVPGDAAEAAVEEALGFAELVLGGHLVCGRGHDRGHNRAGGVIVRPGKYFFFLLSVIGKRDVARISGRLE